MEWHRSCDSTTPAPPWVCSITRTLQGWVSGTLTLGHPYSSGVVLWSSQSLLTKQLTLTHISARGVV